MPHETIGGATLTRGAGTLSSIARPNSSQKKNRKRISQANQSSGALLEIREYDDDEDNDVEEVDLANNAGIKEKST